MSQKSILVHTNTEYYQSRVKRNKALSYRLGQTIKIRNATVKKLGLDELKQACISRAKNMVASGLCGLQSKINEVYHG